MATDAAHLSPRRRGEMRAASLRQEREPFMALYRDISTHQQPRLGRFLVNAHAEAPKYNPIYDNTALFAVRTLQAGMMSGASSPARPWFRLTLADKDLAEYGPVKTWLHRTGMLLRDVFARSNTYNMLRHTYTELGLFGTAASLITENFDNVVHHHMMTVGEYMLGANELGQIDSICREFPMTVGQMVQRFGRDKCSQAVRNMYDRHSLDARIKVTQIIEPRTVRDPRKRDNLNMPWKSIYFEDAKDNPDALLEESGYKRFQVFAPRWSSTPGEVYGTGPGFECQGDVRQLQFEQLRKGQAIDYQTNPPLQVPVAFKGSGSGWRLPGGVSYYDATGPNAGVRSAFEVNLDLQHLSMDILDVRQRINRAYYVDLFLMLANDTTGTMTATEVAERHEEKLLMIGPVQEGLQGELFEPLIDCTFDMCADAGILPETPPELEGHDIDVDYVGLLAQAQRAISVRGMDRLIGFVTAVAAGKQDPSAWDVIDTDQATQDHAEAFGVNPETIRDDDAIAAMREQRMKAQAAQQAAAVGSSRVDLQACKLEYSIVSPK